MAAKTTDRRRTRVLGIPVDVGPDVFAAALELQERGGGQIVTLNAEMTMAALADPELEAVMEAAELVIPDGAGVVWAVGRQGYRVKRTPGIELAYRLLEHAAAAGWRVALVGASPAVMQALRERLPRALPDLDLAFSCDGYQPAEAWPGLEEELRQLRPHLVLVALGVPRQEIWIQRFRAARAASGWGWAAASTCGRAPSSGPPAGWGRCTSNGSTG